MPDSDSEAPLAGLRVLELGHVVAAPYATLMLSDLGADVVKVEHPEQGDHMRVAGETARAIFTSLNRDKQSVCLDLKAAADRRSFRRLVQKTDVIVENFGPGTMENLSLGYEALCQEENEALVYVHLKGFDPSGPYADRSATDPIIQAMSGLMSVTGTEETPPARAGTSIIDISSAQNAVLATLLALRRRRESGTGEQLTVPLFRTGVALMGYWLAYRQQSGENPRRMGASHTLYAPYDVYPTADDEYVFLGAASDAHWASCKEELGLSLSFESRAERLANRETIDEAIAAVTETRTRTDLVDGLLAAGVPAAPVNEVSDLEEDPHLAAVGALTSIDTPEADDVAVPWTIPWRRAPAESDDPPELDEHTDSVLAALEIDRPDS